jgi:hypothetical protein
METEEIATRQQQYLDTTAAAAYCGFARTSFEKFRVTGTGPKFTRPPGSRLIKYTRAALDEWMARGVRASTSERGPGEKPHVKRPGPKRAAQATSERPEVA